jgi:hypothetical protein
MDALFANRPCNNVLMARDEYEASPSSHRSGISTPMEKKPALPFGKLDIHEPSSSEHTMNRVFTLAPAPMIVEYRYDKDDATKDSAYAVHAGNQMIATTCDSSAYVLLNVAKAFFMHRPRGTLKDLPSAIGLNSYLVATMDQTALIPNRQTADVVKLFEVASLHPDT